VEEQVLGDPADCVLAATAEDAKACAPSPWCSALAGSAGQSPAGARRARRVGVPAQLCLPFQPGAVSAALLPGDAGYELVRQSQLEGLGLTLPAQPQAALQTLRALAGDQPVTLYLAPAQMAQFAPLAAEVPHLTLEEDHWAHWVAASRGAGWIWRRHWARPAPRRVRGSAGAGRCASPCWRCWST
jgi:general secretion pathway protein L